MIQPVKSILSTVVLTQNNRCNTIPRTNNPIAVYKNDVRKINEKIYAPIMVIMTSITAILNIR